MRERAAIERELADLGVGVDYQVVPQGQGNVNAYGRCSIRVGNAAISFWPLAPGTTVPAATPPPAPPAVPPRFGIIDVLVQPTADPTVIRAVAAPAILARVTPQPTTRSLPLVPDANNASRICVAVPVAANATHFEGTLRLEIRRGTIANPGPLITVDLPVRVAAGATVADLFVFFVVHRNANRRCAWTKVQVVRHTPPQAAVAGAAAQLNLLRDNGTFGELNRRTALLTGADGFVANGARNVVGVPIGWPLIFKITAAGFSPRSHMLRFAAANVSNNLAPHVAQAAHLVNANVSLQGRRFMLDAGHGVVYALSRHRRSQEWFVAHRIIDRVSEILRQRHTVNAADIFFTRTAGFGLIEPARIQSSDAPERGDGRFSFDLANRRVRSANAQVILRDISDLLLTQHTGANNAPAPIAAADRTRVLTLNPATVGAIQTRLNQQLGPGHRVRPNSIRWDAVTNNYVFTREPTAGGAGSDRPLPIRTTDQWSIDDAMMQALIDRSARWSMANEIGSASATQIAGHPFRTAARVAMQGAGALDYMRARIRGYLPPAANHPWATGGIKGWGLTRRVQFYNATACDLYVSVHENAAGGKGGMALVSRAAQGANAPPQDQIRLGKIALKYLDGFDQGLRGGGIARENQGNATPPLQSGNQRRGSYLYLEIEFMDARTAGPPQRYRYEDMVQAAFIDRVSEQIVAAAVEILVAPQPQLDAVTLNNQFRPLW